LQDRCSGSCGVVSFYERSRLGQERESALKSAIVVIIDFVYVRDEKKRPLKKSRYTGYLETKRENTYKADVQRKTIHLAVRKL